MDLTLRRATLSDKEAVSMVETLSTPGLRYLDQVYEQFALDKVGEFIVAEHAGELVACGKFTVLHDNSAWLEALRVRPEYQGMGIGKLFYQRFFELASAKSISIMRMYTNISNHASKGLAEHFGFRHVGTYRGMSESVTASTTEHELDRFTSVNNPTKAKELMMPYSEQFQGFIVMNRTFYALTPEICTAFAQQERVFFEPSTNSLVVVGSRFMPKAAAHIALLGGSLEQGLHFARRKARAIGAGKIVCMAPPSAQELHRFLCLAGFSQDNYDCIVMEARLK